MPSPPPERGVSCRVRQRRMLGLSACGGVPTRDATCCGREHAGNRSTDVRRGSVVWSLLRGGEAVQRRCVRAGRKGHMRTVAAPGYGQQWRLSPTEVESRRCCKGGDHVEREGARAEPRTV